MRVTLAIPAQMVMLPGRAGSSLNLAAPRSLFHQGSLWLRGSLCTAGSSYLCISNAHFNIKRARLMLFCVL